MHLEDPTHALSRSPGISLVGSVHSEEPTSGTCFGPLETPGATLQIHGEQMPMIYISQTPGSQCLKSRAPSSWPGVRTHPEMQGGWGLPSGSDEAAPPGTVCFTLLLAPSLPSPPSPSPSSPLSPVFPESISWKDQPSQNLQSGLYSLTLGS